MNTTDVRDTAWDQRIFWVSALPLTFGVVALAFLYGYKSDKIMDAVARRFRPDEENSACHIFEIDIMPLTEEVHNEKTGKAASEARESGNMAQKGLVGRLKRRKNKRAAFGSRRRTGESLLSQI